MRRSIQNFAEKSRTGQSTDRHSLSEKIRLLLWDLDFIIIADWLNNRSRNIKLPQVGLLITLMFCKSLVWTTLGYSRAETTERRDNHSRAWNIILVIFRLVLVLQSPFLPRALSWCPAPTEAQVGAEVRWGDRVWVLRSGLTHNSPSRPFASHHC